MEGDNCAEHSAEAKVLEAGLFGDAICNGRPVGGAGDNACDNLINVPLCYDMGLSERVCQQILLEVEAHHPRG